MVTMGDDTEAWLSAPTTSAALIGAVVAVVLVLRLFRWMRRAVGAAF
jgi:hypothetical protein